MFSNAIKRNFRTCPKGNLKRHYLQLDFLNIITQRADSQFADSEDSEFNNSLHFVTPSYRII